MMSIGLSESETRDRLAQFNHHAKSFGLTVACINSPCNVTVSGEEELIDILKSHLDGDKVFARKLRVPLAYHSGQMQTISEKYASLMGSLSKPENSSGGDPVPMLSSVTGNAVSGSSLVDPAYWVRNMVSPVRFSQAVSAMCSASPATITKKLDMSHLLVPVVDQLLEIGPHAVLQGPLRDILGSLPERTKRPAITYSSALRRGQKATDTLLGTIGSLFCKGVPVDLRTVNEPNTKGPIHQLPSRTLLTNLPEYPFDHSRRYWHESRLSRNYTLRSEPPSELVGVTSRDSKIKWRHFLRRSESPWIEHHVVNGKVVYPAAGMLAMGIEAARQIVAGTPGMIARGYTLRDVRFENPLDLSVNPNVLEVQTSLTPISAASASNNTGPMFDFIIESFGESDEPRVNCRGVVSVEVPSGTSTWSETMAEEERRRMACELLEAVKACDMAVDSKHMYDFLEASGYGYGRTFQRSREQRCSRHHPKRAAARISMFSSSPQPHIIHPATLDAVVQLCFTCLSSGGQEPMATGIPSRLGSMWVAASGLSLPAPPEETDTLTGVVSLTKATSRTHLYSGAMLGNGHNETTPPDVMLWYDDLEMTDISSAVSPRTASSKPDQQFCMTISTQVAIDKLTSQEKCDLLQSMHPEAEDVSQLHRDLEVLAALSLDEMTSTVDTRHINDRGDWARRYWNWAEYHLSRFRRDPAWDDPESVFGKARRSLPELRERLSSTSSGIGKAYAAVSLNLHRMLEGKIAPLELLMPSGLLDGFYAEGNTYRSGTLASSYLSLVAHQKPDLRIIEVGGGTASTTKIMVPALSDSASGSLRCARYDFTDISPGFLENAREAFTKYQSKMTFGTLNVENDPVPQGYEEAAYDVVIADNVLHATLDLSKTLRNVRKLLKPGGKVFLHEWFRADGWSTGFIFGLLSGWWLGADTGREMSPNVSVEEWDSLLKEAGFTGVDEVLRDFDEDGSYDQAYLVATAAPIPADRDPKTSVTLVVGPSAVSETQDKLIKSISGPLTAQFGTPPVVLSLEEAALGDRSYGPDDIVVCLVDYGSSSPFLADINEARWHSLQDLVRSCRRILWVSSGGGQSPHPDQGILSGLARTLRLEHYELQLVTLALEPPAILDEARNTKAVRHLTQVTREMALTGLRENYEQEYTEIAGRLHIHRLVEADRTTETLQQKLAGTQVVSRPVGEVRFDTTPTDDTPEGIRYAESSAVDEQEDISADAVEIAVRAASLQSLERAAALGWDGVTEKQPPAPAFCDYYTGTVLRAGASSGFGPGDHVLATSRGPFRSHVQLSSECVASLALEVPFSAACASASPATTAYNALVEIGRVRPSDSVLVHDISSPIGKAAARLLARVGVKEIWATAADEDDCRAAVEQLGYKRNHVLPKSWFDSPSLLASRWKQAFDIVLMPYANADSLPLAMSCVRPGGHYIVMRTGIPRLGTAQQMQGVPASVSLSIIQHGSERPSADALRHAAAEAAVEPTCAWTREFSAPELSAAFSLLRTMDEKERIVIQLNESDMVEVSDFGLSGSCGGLPVRPPHEPLTDDLI
jgi:NADPH:quinone reductase-like Zn-dependent oxidoreductase/SAM-dependent methyltransferase